MPQINNLTRLVLVIHQREIRKPSNTGALAVRCLLNSELHLRGAVGAPADYGGLAQADATNLYLFPGEDAIPLTPAFCATLVGPVRLIVPDGNWGQAARVWGKLPEHVPITRVTLPPGPPTQYRLRHESPLRPEGLATLEAIARALETLEGPHVSEPMLHVFRMRVERSLWAKGKLPAHAVFQGIPDATVNAH